MNWPIVGAIVVLVVSFRLPAFRFLQDFSGWDCFLECQRQLFNHSRHSYLLDHLFDRVYFPALCIDSVAFIVLAIAMICNPLIGRERAIATYIIAGHVLSWFVLEGVFGDEGVRIILVGYYVWAAAFVTLAIITFRQRKTAADPSKAVDSSRVVPLLRFLRPTFSLPLEPTTKVTLAAAAAVFSTVTLLLFFWRRGALGVLNASVAGGLVVYGVVLVRRFTTLAFVRRFGFIAVFACAWFKWIGTHNYVFDLAAMIAAGALTALAQSLLSRWSNRRIVVAVVAFLACFLPIFWGFAGFMDHLATSPRKKTIAFELNANSHSVGAHRIGLALSGGGYRAAVFHAGVIYELQRRGVPIHVISSVSGGSITAAAVILGMSPREFAALVASGRFNLLRTLVNPQYVVPLAFDYLVPWESERIDPLRLAQLDAHHARTNAQADLLKTAIGFGNNAAFPQDPNVEWIINSTDLGSKQLVGLHRDGLFLLPIANAKSFFQTAVLKVPERFCSPYGSALYQDRAGGSHAVALEQIVAASGAFPGAFEPLRFTVGDQQFHLADGGLVDNSGVVMLQVATDLAQHPPENPVLQRCRVDVVIASDGSDLSETFFDNGTSSTHDRTVDGISAAADAMYAFSGAPYPSADTTPPLVLAISPRRLYDPDSKEFLRRVEALNYRDKAEIYEIMGVDPTTRSPPGGPRVYPSQPASGPKGLEKSLGNLVGTFRDAKTLDTRLTNATCQDLFCLGQVLVIINSAELSQLRPASGGK